MRKVISAFAIALFILSITFTATAPLASGQTAGLSKPTGLTASNITTTSFTLTWNAVTGATGYEIYGPLGCNGAPATSGYCGAAYGSRSKVITGLTPGANYNVMSSNSSRAAFTVLAFNRAGTYSQPATRLAVQMLSAGNTGSTTTTPGTTPAAPTSGTWGAYTGNFDSTMAAFESYVGKPMNINAMFWGWDDIFPGAYTTTGTQGKTLLLFWEPSFGYDQINNGSKDAYIAQFAQGAKAYGYPVMLAPFPEFNIDENAYGYTIGTNTPQKFIDAWRRVHGIFQAQSASNVHFVLPYNNVSIPAAPYSLFYPGSAYVDSIGLSIFSFHGQSFAQQSTAAFAEASQFGKPMWIASAGTSNASNTFKSQFIADLDASGYAWVWFNAGLQTISSGSLQAFKNAIQ